MFCIDDTRNYKGISIDKTLYYKDFTKKEDYEEEIMTVKCVYCGKTRDYLSGEMVWKHNHYKFCSYTCRARWRKENPQKQRFNSIDKGLQNVDKEILED
jgi:endogenous inhibitor of DNA gyrase (YacG/DUF329 family)